MIHHRSADEVTRFDRAKLVFLLLLVAGATVLWLLEAPKRNQDDSQQVAANTATTPTNKPDPDLGSEQSSGLSAEASPTTPAVETKAPVVEEPPQFALGRGTLYSPKRKVSIEGVAPSGATISLKDDTGQVTTVATTDKGIWEGELMALSGKHTITAAVLTDNGKPDDTYAATTYSYTLDESLNTVAMDVPDISYAGGGFAKGRAVPNETVGVYIDGALVGTTTADENGQWSLPIKKGLPWGEHTIYALSNPIAKPEQYATTVAHSFALTPTLQVEKFDYQERVTVSGTAPVGTYISAQLDGGKATKKKVPSTGAWDFVFADQRPGKRELSLNLQAVDTGPVVATVKRDFSRPLSVLGLKTDAGPRGTLLSGVHMDDKDTKLMVGDEQQALLQRANGTRWSYLLALPDGEYSAQTFAVDKAGHVWAKSPVFDVKGVAAGHQFTEKEQKAIDAYFVQQETEIKTALKEELQSGHVTMQRKDDGALKITIAGDVTFGNNSAVIQPKGEVILRNVANLAKQYPKTLIDTIGHTDSRGNISYNYNLSVKRGESAKAKLKSFGITDKRITALGLGEAHPIATNATPEGQAKNRRVDVVIIASPDAEW